MVKSSGGGGGGGINLEYEYLVSIETKFINNTTGRSPFGTSDGENIWYMDTSTSYASGGATPYKFKDNEFLNVGAMEPYADTGGSCIYFSGALHSYTAKDKIHLVLDENTGSWTRMGYFPTELVWEGMIIKDNKVWGIGTGGMVYTSIDGDVWTRIDSTDSNVRPNSIVLYSDEVYAMYVGGSNNSTSLYTRIYRFTQDYTWKTLLDSYINVGINTESIKTSKAFQLGDELLIVAGTVCLKWDENNAQFVRKTELENTSYSDRACINHNGEIHMIGGTPANSHLVIRNLRA